MERISFGIVGGGWRTEFFIRIARALPNRFEVAGVAIRNGERRESFKQAWGCPVFANPDQLLDTCAPRFVVTSVSWDCNPGLVKDLVARGIPVLSETPPAPGIHDLNELYSYVQDHDGKVQVAEQFHLQPEHAARLQVIRLGLLGSVTEAEISCGHGYHGISLVRRSLGSGLERPVVSARTFLSPVIKGPDRAGPPLEESVANATRLHVWFDYGDRLGVLDFMAFPLHSPTDEQYFNWVRNHRVLIRGDRGEMIDRRVSYLENFRSPVHLELERRCAGVGGNLEGAGLQSIHLGDSRVYENPFRESSLSDEEIAIASCLENMAAYTAGSDGFYSLAEACQDRYLDILCWQSVEQERAVNAEIQAWTG